MCIRDRACTSNCVAYIVSDDLKEDLRMIIEAEIPCMRLFMEMSSALTPSPLLFDDDEAEEDEEADSECSEVW